MADSCPVTTRGKQQRGGNDKRRFSDEQIRRLEVMFESESKLEPRKKVEVARELGLQPRQVAIWFQNRRARWKSKHIEKEYSALLASYNDLAAEFEKLKEEKHDLLIQLEKLKAKAGDEEEAGGGGGARSGSSDGEAESVKLDFDVMKNNIDVGGGWELGIASVSASDDEAAHAAFHGGGGGGEEEELLRMVEAETTPDWGGLDCDDMIINQSSSQWWGFWS